jgi:exopolysaccharide biosynthesis polyprenyl glycosylphosphotransferase
MQPIAAPVENPRPCGQTSQRVTRVEDADAPLPRSSVDRREVSRRRDALFRRSLACADVAALAVAVAGAVAIGPSHRLLPAAAAVPIIFVFIVKAMGLYDRDEHLLHKSTLDEVPAIFSIASLAVLLLFLGGDLFIQGDLDRGQVLFAWVALFFSDVSLRALARTIATARAPVERCLLVGDPVAAEHIREKLALSGAVKAQLVGVVAPAERGPEGTPLPPADLSRVVDEHAIERVILATDTESQENLLYTIRELKVSGVKVSVLPEVSRVAGSSLELDHLHGITLLGMRRFEFTRSSRIVKRSFDIAGSLVALVALTPIFAITAIAIRVDSPGPIFFRQRRVGRHGAEFQMVKFRSMVTEADQMKAELQHLNTAAKGLFKIPADPRLTRVGKFIRRWQLDEMPQFLNVLRGEMSLVGPRPLIPSEDRQIEGWYRRRLDLPPGMTGHWQILGSSGRIPLNEMVKLDYLYVANWSLWGDIRLLLRTVPFILGRRGI